MAVNDIYQLSLIYTQSGREWVNTLFYRESIADPSKTTDEIAQALAAEWPPEFFETRLDRCLSNEVELVNSIAQRIHPTRSFDKNTSWSDKAGIVFQPPLPAHTCCLIQQHGEDAGRSFQGRLYLSGMPSTFETDGAINTTGETAYNTWANVPLGENSIDPIAASSLRLRHTNFSRKLAAAASSPWWSDIESATTVPQLATQRNRTLTTRSFSTPVP